MIQERPTDMPSAGKKEEDALYGWQVWHTNGTKCPEGSIPIRRLISLGNETIITSNAGDRVTGGHEVRICLCFN